MNENDNFIVEFKEADKMLQFIFLKREYPNGSDKWDKDIISSEINFSTASVKGKFGASIWSSELYELIVLIEEIQKNTGEVFDKEFSFMEEAVKFKFSLSATGHIETDVTVCASHVDNITATFKLYLDQSYLPNILSSLEKVLIKFPPQTHNSNS